MSRHDLFLKLEIRKLSISISVIPRLYLLLILLNRRVHPWSSEDLSKQKSAAIKSEVPQIWSKSLKTRSSTSMSCLETSKATKLLN